MSTSAVQAPATAPRAEKPGRAPGHVARRILFWLTLILLSIIFIAPLFWMLSTSLKTPNEATSLPLTWIPSEIDTSSYAQLLSLNSVTPVLRWFLNSLVAGLANAALIVAIDAMAAYALARMRFRGRGIIFGTVVGTIFLPAFVFLVPNFLIVYQLGWLDTLWAIIIPSAGGAFGVFFLYQFFSGLPKELEEAAEIDGANQWTIFFKVLLPLARPALATLAVLSFLTNWNDFLWPVYVLFSSSQLTLPAGLSTLQGAATTNYPLIMAGAVIASVPALILFVAAQKQIVSSVARSGLTGS
jgi:multiple sugar transport system permease protein